MMGVRERGGEDDQTVLRSRGCKRESIATATHRFPPQRKNKKEFHVKLYDSWVRFLIWVRTRPKMEGYDSPDARFDRNSFLKSGQ